MTNHHLATTETSMKWVNDCRIAVRRDIHVDSGDSMFIHLDGHNSILEIARHYGGYIMTFWREEPDRGEVYGGTITYSREELQQWHDMVGELLAIPLHSEEESA